MTFRFLLNRLCLVAALFSLSLAPAGCSDDDAAEDPVPSPTPDPEPGPEPNGSDIVFAPEFSGTAAPRTLGVYAFDTGGGTWNENAVPNFMVDQLLENRDGTWTYDPVKQWPEASGLAFFAYGPRAQAGNGLRVTDASHRGAPVLTYEMPSATECHTDICIATPRLNATDADDPLRLEFRSVMAKIGFRIKGQGEKISRIAVRGIQQSGEISLDVEDRGSMTWSEATEYSSTEYEVGLRFDEGADYVTAAQTMTDVTAEDGFLYLIPQNFTYNARIVVTVDGEKMGFPFESLFQVLPGQEYFIDLIIPGDKPLDYTDNASAAFLIAPTDAAEAANISWADATAECAAAGYRLPSYNEGLMILFYMNGIENNNFRYASYWCSTTSKEDTSVDNAMGYNIMPWMGIYMPKAGITAARCVQDAPEGGRKYPWVDTSDPEGPIIVSRDADGGVTPSSYVPAYDTEFQVFHDNWTTTPDHDWGADADKISRKLQVANADAAADKVVWGEFACPEGWRKPTMMEMALIYAMGGAVESSYDADNEPVSDTPLYAVQGFTPLNADYYWVASMVSGRGGRNPATWSFAATPRNGSGTATGPDANWVRCVRDVE